MNDVCPVMLGGTQGRNGKKKWKIIVLLFKIPERILAYDNPSKLVCRSTMQLKHKMCTMVWGCFMSYLTDRSQLIKLLLCSDF